MDKVKFGVPFVVIPGFGSNKRDTKLLRLTWTIKCHCKEFFQIAIPKFVIFRVSVGRLAFMMLQNVQNASLNRYNNKNPLRSEYISSIDKMTFRLDIRPIIDSREL